MVFKTTPGPWKVAATAAREIISGTCIVATPKRANREAGEFRPNTEAEVEANAHLIAAAPDMLAALKDAAECLKRLPNVEGAYRVTCLGQVQAAIRLAEGSS